MRRIILLSLLGSGCYEPLGPIPPVDCPEDRTPIRTDDVSLIGRSADEVVSGLPTQWYAHWTGMRDDVPDPELDGPIRMQLLATSAEEVIAMTDEEAPRQKFECPPAGQESLSIVVDAFLASKHLTGRVNGTVTAMGTDYYEYSLQMVGPKFDERARELAERFASQQGWAIEQYGVYIYPSRLNVGFWAQVIEDEGSVESSLWSAKLTPRED